ncbi:DUF6064 family protein [Polaromonas sp.]|uniref:DUF6064 family protein n=1 Tax=Polaromonas sp. TaxID=1869339 RepID=UPI00375263A6
MPEWWTYTLSDFLMFSPRIYWRMVEQYNRDFWPLHVLFLAAGLAGMGLAASGRALGFRWIACGLAVVWSWVGWAFLWERYAIINWAAQYMAAAFAVQALLLLAAGLMCSRTETTPGTAARMSGGLLASAGLLYPLLGMALGRPWVQAEVFGMTPEPTALFTLGLLLLSGQPASRAWRFLLFPIPLLGLLLGAATGWTFLN